MHTTDSHAARGGEHPALGALLALLQAGAFLGFLGYCAFAPSPPAYRPGQGLPLHFTLGLGVIALGTLLTAVYVRLTHDQGGRHD